MNIKDEAVWDGAGKAAKKVMDKFGGGKNIAGIAPAWNNMNKFAAIIGGITIAGTAAHSINKTTEKLSMRKEMRRQEVNLRRKSDKDLDDRFTGFDQGYQAPPTYGTVQGLYNKRNGHSNSWGGRKY